MFELTSIVQLSIMESLGIMVSKYFVIVNNIYKYQRCAFINIVKMRLQDISPNIAELYVKNEILHKMIFLTRCQYFHGWKLCLQVFRTERVGKESGQVRWDVWWWSSYRQLWWWQWQKWWKLLWTMFTPSPPMLTMLIMRSKDAIRICFDLEW